MTNHVNFVTSCYLKLLFYMGGGETKLLYMVDEFIFRNDSLPNVNPI